MKVRSGLFFVTVAVLATGLNGCLHASQDTAGYAVEKTANLNVSFDQSWQIVKSVLREQKLELYTRDLRGHFVAYSKTKRDLGLFTPRRVQYTVDIAKVSDQETMVRVDCVRQVYGVTLLTYPGWHDRKTQDTREIEAIMQAIQAKAGASAK